MFNHSPGKLRGGLGSRHGEDPSPGGGGLDLGIENPNQQQQKQQQQQDQQQQHFLRHLHQFQNQPPQNRPQQQTHSSHHQPVFSDGLGFASPPAQDASSMHRFSTNMGPDQVHDPADGQDVTMGDAHEPEANVTNLIAHFENGKKKPPKPNKPSHIAAFNRANNPLRVTSPTGEQFTSSSLRVRSGSIGRPPPVRFGSMGYQGHSGMRVSSPIASQSVEAYGNRTAGRSTTSRATTAATPTSPYTTIASSMDMPVPLRRQASTIGAMQVDGVTSSSSDNFLSPDAISPGPGSMGGGGAHSPFGFVDNGNRMVRSVQGHMLDTFGGTMGSPIIGTPTSPFGNMDYSAPRVVSPIQSPSVDPYGDIGVLAGIGVSNAAASPFDAMSAADRVTSPMETTGVDAFDFRMDTKPPPQFVHTPTDAFQSLDPFQSLNPAVNHHQPAPPQVSFSGMASPSSTDPFGDIGLLIKQEPNVDQVEFGGLSPAPRSATTVHAPIDFSNPGYFQAQQPLQQSHSHQQHPQQPLHHTHQQHHPQQHQPQPPPPPAKKLFLSRSQQDMSGNQSTPGFNIWRPPVPSTPKPVLTHSQQASSGSISSSAAPNKSAAFLAQSRAELRIQTDHPNVMSHHQHQQQQQQPFSSTLSITSPTSAILPSSSTENPVQSPLAASPV